MKDQRRVATLVVALSAFAAFGVSATAADRPDLTAPLVLKDQGSFFVGGVETRTNATSGDPAGQIGYPNTDVIKTGQMYVQFQAPKSEGAHAPIVLLHGCCLSAKTWEDTPDGRMG